MKLKTLRTGVCCNFIGMIKALLLLLSSFLVLGVSAQTETPTEVFPTDTAEIILVDTVAEVHEKTASALLRRIWPEPFYDFVQLDFQVFDCTEHGVEIKIVNSQNELVYSNTVQLCEGHESVRINTVDFFMTGLYSIQIKIDNKYMYYRKFKRTKY